LDAVGGATAASLHAMTLPAGVRIRAVALDDAEELARLHVDVWEDAYRDLMPATVFEERRATIPERVDRWRRAITEGPARTLVAESSTGLVGFSSVGKPRDDDVAVGEELWALYVRAQWWDKRAGHALLVAALADRPAYLWVLRGNDRAITFYRKHGFAEDGVTRRDDHGVELRMVRPAGTSGARD
jgi:ribosomal protein S18 acetylase RimI-like enzyme